MAAPAGNRFWEARSSHGRNPKFETPEQLWDACCQYFQWNADNPLYEDRIVAYQGDVKHEAVPKMRAMTLGGMCIFIGISHDTWENWRRNRQDFFVVIKEAENVIRTQKFEGAAADLLNANIISRDLGLADKAELTGKDGAALNPPPADPMELARAVAFLLQAGVAKG